MATGSAGHSRLMSAFATDKIAAIGKIDDKRPPAVDRGGHRVHQVFMDMHTHIEPR